MNLLNHNQPEQTEFAAESPLYEQPTITQPPVNPEQMATDPTQQKPPMPTKPAISRKWLIIGISAGVMMLLAAILLLASFFNRPDTGDDLTDDIPPVLNSTEKTAFENRVEELEAELELADPNQDDLPFPPIDEEINLSN